MRWGTVATIATSWVVSPLLGGVAAFGIFRVVQVAILSCERPLDHARRLGPLFVFAVVFVIALVTLFKGLKNPPRRATRARRARGAVFAHGSNDVANAVGPLAAIFAAREGAALAGESPVASWMLLVGRAGIVLGLATYGYRVIETVGRSITELTPTRGFAAEFAASTTIVIASKAGIPVSTTHALVGAVLGVGLARGIGALDGRVVARIALSWLGTLPTGALLAAFFYFFFKGVFAP